MTDSTFPAKAAQPDAGVAPSITFLCRKGDITITWTEENRAAVLEMVRRKMAEGYSFFILKPLPFMPGLKRKVKLKAVEELESASGLVLKDRDAARWIAAVNAQENGASVEVARHQGTPEQQSTGVRARTAEEVVASQTMAVRPIVGG